MRITGGTCRGRNIKVPATGLRPTADMVRQALFNILGPMPDAVVLDLYAGSGAVGLEALSRGAGAVVFVEQDRRAASVIALNLRMLDFSCRVVTGPVLRFLAAPEELVFDLIFMDPPYHNDEEKERLAGTDIVRLLAPGGRLVYEASRKEEPPVFAGLSRISSRSYGDTVLHFFEKPA